MKSYGIGISAAQFGMTNPQQRSSPNLKATHQIASSPRINIGRLYYSAMCYGASAAVVMLYRVTTRGCGVHTQVTQVPAACTHWTANLSDRDQKSWVTKMG